MDEYEPSEGKLLAEEFSFHAGLKQLKNADEETLRELAIIYYISLHHANRAVRKMAGRLLAKGLPLN